MGRAERNSFGGDGDRREVRGCGKRLAGGETTERGQAWEVSGIEMRDLGTVLGKRARAHFLCPYMVRLCFIFPDMASFMWLGFLCSLNDHQLNFFPPEALLTAHTPSHSLG